MFRSSTFEYVSSVKKADVFELRRKIISEQLVELIRISQNIRTQSNSIDRRGLRINFDGASS